MVTVCKFFLTNTCRYGDRCRYSHTIPPEYHEYRTNNPYVYDARYKNESHRYSSPQNVSSSGKDELDKLMPEYMKKICEDINQVEDQHMWPFTCYSFTKSHGNLPDWNDISMEEIRWEAYQAQTNGTFQNYLTRMQELLSKAKETRNIFLQQPSKQAESILREHIKGNNTIPSTNQNVPFLMHQSNKTISNFSFASAFDKLPQQPSVFGNQSNDGFSTQNLQSNIFNNQTYPPPVQQSTTFFSGKTSFSTTQARDNIFSSTPIRESSAPAFSMDVVNNPFQSSSSQTQDPFHFRPKQSQQQNAVNMSVYSKVEDLSKEDYEAFEANTFTLENIPFAPPPKELCH